MGSGQTRQASAICSSVSAVPSGKEWNEKEKEDPEWGKEHPLVFDVKKEDGEIRVSV